MNTEEIFFLKKNYFYFYNSLKNQSVSNRDKDTAGVLHQFYPLGLSVYFVSLAKHFE